jgi:hypothetical protein
VESLEKTVIERRLQQDESDDRDHLDRYDHIGEEALSEFRSPPEETVTMNQTIAINGTDSNSFVTQFFRNEECYEGFALVLVGGLVLGIVASSGVCLV